MGRVRKPFCADCGSLRCHVVTRPDGSMLWLCGSCEVLRNDPDAAKTKNPPGLPSTWPKRGKGKPQKEQLF